MLRLRFLFLILLIGFISVSDSNAQTSNAQEKIELRLRLEKGQTFDQVIVMEQKISETDSKTRSDFFYNSRLGIHNEVLRVNEDGSVIIKSTCTYATSANGSNPNNLERYDSRKPPKIIPNLAAMIAARVGHDFTTTYSKQGEVIKIEGLETLARRLMKIKRIPTELQNQMLEAMREISKSEPAPIIHFAQLSETSVTIGDSWTAANNRSAIGDEFVSTQYTFFARKNGIATISLRSSTVAGSATGEKLPGNQSGVLRIDEDSGLIREYQIHVRSSGRLGSNTPDSAMMYSKITMRGWTTSPR